MPKLTTLTLTAVLTLAACDAADIETIGPRGGTVTSLDGRFTLEIPEGALDQQVAIIIGEVDGPTGAMGPSYEVEPQGLAFRIPATVRYDFGSNDQLEDTGASLAIVTEGQQEIWQRLADHALDMEATEVTASAVYSSAYAIVQR